MTIGNKLRLLWHFAYTRWWLRHLNPQALARRQQRQLTRFIRKIGRYGAFRDTPEPERNVSIATMLASLPTSDKNTLLAQFDQYNIAAINIQHALSVAQQAEATRDFTPGIGELSVGLSSGTSGRPGVFLVSEHEQARWAGILLAKLLPAQLLLQILFFWRAPLRIAFFLRADSNLYQTLNTRRIDFRFFDLTKPLWDQCANLDEFSPQVVVAPASVLHQLCEWQQQGKLSIAPTDIVSVAEVLDENVRALISMVFPAASLRQIYQATEGFLGYSCEAGGLHLNETHLIIERQWIDEEKTRFHPVITDFSRESQAIVRYRLDDILLARATPCSCGRAESTIAGIEGRADEVLYATCREHGTIKPLFPDTVRQHLLAFNPPLQDYRIIQEQDRWLIQLTEPDQQHFPALAAHLQILFRTHALEAPLLIPQIWTAGKPGDKVRRLLFRGHHANGA